MPTTYDEILTICTSLQASGQALTLRAVRAELAGPISDERLREFVRHAKSELQTGDPEPTEAPEYRTEDLTPPPMPEDLAALPPRPEAIRHHLAHLAGLQRAQEVQCYLTRWLASTELLLEHLAPAAVWLATRRQPEAAGWQSLDPLGMNELASLWRESTRESAPRASALATRLEQALTEVEHDGAKPFDPDTERTA